MRAVVRAGLDDLTGLDWCGQGDLGQRHPRVIAVDAVGEALPVRGGEELVQAHGTEIVGRQCADAVADDHAEAHPLLGPVPGQSEGCRDGAHPRPCWAYGFSSASRISSGTPSSVALGPSAAGNDSVIDIGIALLRYRLFEPSEGFQVFGSQSGT